MATGVVKWFDSDNLEYAIVENADTNKLIILDTKAMNLPADYITQGDEVRFEAQLSPFGPIAKELEKL